ncbi:unnamed protein product [Sphagnum tenellum]
MGSKSPDGKDDGLLDKTVRRGHRRSSWAQSYHIEPQDKANEAVSKIQLSMRGAIPDPKNAVIGGPPPRQPDRKEMGLSAQALVELQRAFQAVEETDGGQLDQVSFFCVFPLCTFCLFSCLLACTTSAFLTQMEHLFMKIDSNSSGAIGFDDFTSYILLQQLAKEEEPAAEHTTFIKVTTFGSKKFGRCEFEDSESERSDEEERSADDDIMFRPANRVEAGLDTVGRPSNIIEKILLLEPLNVYVTATQEGMLKLWSADSLKPTRQVENGDGAWITDMVVMAQQPLAVFAMDRSVTFYDTGRLSFDCLGRITQLENAPMCATWLRVAENDKLLFGDELGILHTYTFNDEWGGEHPREGFGVHEKNLPPGMAENIPWVLHSDWMTTIKYLSHSNSLITTSMDGNLLMLDFEKRHLKWSGKEHAHGIYSCDYCRSYNFIVTCGLERYINIWNPFTAKTMGVLHGHEASVFDVQVNEMDNQIVSISADSVIKVWDMRSSRCLQTIVEKSISKPSRCNILYDNKRQVLLAGGNTLEMWHKRRAREARTSKICCCLYNPLFHQVVVGEVDSLVMLWNIETGEDIFTFSDTHRATRISAMAFDASWRRLLIGGEDGSLRMWNFNNGQCLKEFLGFGQNEISCIICMNVARVNFAAAGGWNKKVCLWGDTIHTEREYIDKNFRGHTEDVTCMTFCHPSTLCTGGCDGKVIVWKMDGMIIRTMRPPEHDLKDIEYKTIISLIFCRDLNRTLIGSVADGWLLFWRMHDGTLVHELFTNNHGGVGPIVADGKAEVLYTADSKGYVRAWDLTTCHFKKEDTSPSTTPQLFSFRAHHENIVSIDFVEVEQLIITCSHYGTIRLWNSMGVRIGQFGQPMLWDLSKPPTWRTREPSYLSQPLTRQPPEGVDSPVRVPTRGTTTRGSRVSIHWGTPRHSTASAVGRGSLEESSSTAETTTEGSVGTEIIRMPPISEEALKRQFEEKKAAVLELGPPHLRLESWYAPLQAAYERQLPIKKLSPVGPLMPPNLSDISKERSATLAGQRALASPNSTTSMRSKKKKARTPSLAHVIYGKTDVRID